jgi:hypothetical protein
MAKRVNRLKPIEHEGRQLENLKTLQPNATPAKYRALSDALVDVAISALEIVYALESANKGALDFERFYELVDSLEDTLGEPAN